MLTKFSNLLIQRRLPAAIFKTPFRSYLSENYKCTQSWTSRLQPEYIQKINLDSLYYDIEQSFQHYGKPSVIDVDIFINKLTDNVNTDEVSDLLYKLRLTEETSNTLPSTGHAVVRSFLENDYIEELLNILDDRLNYGVFLDHYTTNLLLDELIKRKDFLSAARVATFLMLQEDFDSEISTNLALYACWNYLEDPKPFYQVQEQPEETKKTEEVKVRVNFIRNEFFDNHFDLRDNLHLVGKTLSLIGANIKDPKIGKNAQLLGEILFQKYDNALNTFTDAKRTLYKDIVAIALKYIEQNDQLNENGQKLKDNLQNIASDPSLNATSFSQDVETLIKSAVAKLEEKDIIEQEKLYKDWIELRATRLQEELQRLERAKRLQDVENTLESMKKDEQKLWFFENEEKIDLEIDSKKVFYPKRWFGKKKKPRTIDENYVPPEIRQKK